MRLDAELLARTPHNLNTLKDRELELRGHKIPAIENLGVTKDALDSLDLTDNSLTTLSNFPLLRRLSHLLLSSNPIRSISNSVPTSLPNLRTLILANCELPKEALGALGETLGRCSKLEMLCLRGNPVVVDKYYREWIVFKCTKLRSLDYERVTEKERITSRALFLLPTGLPTPLSLALSSSSHLAPTLASLSNTFEPGQAEPVAEVAPGGGGGGGGGKAGRLLSKEEKERVRNAIESAESVEEIRRLQRMLAQGFVPTEKDLKDLQKKKMDAMMS